VVFSNVEELLATNSALLATLTGAIALGWPPCDTPLPLPAAGHRPRGAAAAQAASAADEGCRQIGAAFSSCASLEDVYAHYLTTAEAAANMADAVRTATLRPARLLDVEQEKFSNAAAFILRFSFCTYRCSRVLASVGCSRGRAGVEPVGGARVSRVLPLSSASAQGSRPGVAPHRTRAAPAPVGGCVGGAVERQRQMTPPPPYADFRRR
jgi:hypothetical protein